MERARDVIRRLDLLPHPEGGHYREVHRSRVSLGTPPGFPGGRSALTAIYFLLEQGDFSALHRVRSEEAWVHLGGAPLELVILGTPAQVRRLAPVSEGGTPLAVVPPGALQAARSRGAWTLTTCLVAPGFEFADFEMPGREELLRRHPECAEVVLNFTR
ncbi:MAG: cupin domain-containing protein [Proteobacteria bacterium]|nr:cupin domain-containing protein [Pseudomonadota bacterium]